MSHLLSLIPNLDALTLTVATALAAGIVAVLRALFTLVRRLAAKTETTADDTLINETEKALEEQSRDI